jgi:small subunit ribosomal protein S5
MRNQNQTNNQQQPQEFDEKVIQVSRVSKKTKGGNKIGFSVLMVVGDKKGRVGVGLGKAGDVLSAIRKGIKKAKKKLIQVPLDGTTIPFSLTVKKGAATIMLKPAPQGSGVIAGGPVRAVVEAAGVRDISSKIMGTGNQASNVYATFAALTQISKIVELKNIKLRSIADIEAEEAVKVKAEQEKAKQAAADSKESKKEVAAPKKESKAAPKKETAPKTQKTESPAAEAAPKTDKKVTAKPKKAVAQK